MTLKPSMLKISALSLFLLLTACGGGGGGSNNNNPTTNNGTGGSSSNNTSLDFISVVSFLENTIEDDFKSLFKAPAYTFEVESNTSQRRLTECETGTVIVSKYANDVISGVETTTFSAEYSDFYGVLYGVDITDCPSYYPAIHNFVHGKINYTNKRWLDRGIFHTSSDIIYGNGAKLKVDSEPYFSGDDPTIALQGSLYRHEYGFSPEIQHIKAPYLKYYIAHVRKIGEDVEEGQLIDRSKFIKITKKYGEYKDFDVIKTDNHYKGSYTKETFELDRNKAPYLSENEDDFIKVSLKLTIDFNYTHRYANGKVNFDISFNPETGVEKVIHGYIDYQGRDKTIYTVKNGITTREYGSNVE